MLDEFLGSCLLLALLPGMCQNTPSFLPSSWHTPRQLLGPFSSLLPPLLPPPPACCGSFPLLSLSGLFREHFSLSVCLFACLLAWLAHLFSFEKNRPGQDCWAVHGSHSPTGLLSGCMCSTVNWFIFLAYFFFPLLPTF